jgi:hypothetical protein
MLHRVTGIALALVGLVLVLFLLAVVLTDIEAVIPRKLTLVPVFLIGPVAIVGILGLLPRLEASEREFSARVGAVMLVIAFSCFTMMLVVQQFGQLRVFMDPGAINQIQPEAVTLIRRTVSGVQLGMDFTFDIFFGIGVWLFALAMYRHRDFGKLIGALGTLTAAYLLISNMWAFPQTPGEAGIPDPAAFSLVWWALVIMKDLTQRKMRR